MQTRKVEDCELLMHVYIVEEEFTLLKNVWQQKKILVFYHECHSLIGYITHYLSCFVCGGDLDKVLNGQ